MSTRYYTTASLTGSGPRFGFAITSITSAYLEVERPRRDEGLDALQSVSPYGPLTLGRALDIEPNNLASLEIGLLALLLPGSSSRWQNQAIVLRRLLEGVNYGESESGGRRELAVSVLADLAGPTSLPPLEELDAVLTDVLQSAIVPVEQSPPELRSVANLMQGGGALASGWALLTGEPHLAVATSIGVLLFQAVKPFANRFHRYSVRTTSRSLLEDELRQADQLLGEGIISSEEHQRIRAALIDEYFS